MPDRGHILNPPARSAWRKDTTSIDRCSQTLGMLGAAFSFAFVSFARLLRRGARVNSYHSHLSTAVTVAAVLMTSAGTSHSR